MLSKRIHFVTIKVEKNIYIIYSENKFGHLITNIINSSKRAQNIHSHTHIYKESERNRPRVRVSISMAFKVLKLKLETRICRWAIGTCIHNRPWYFVPNRIKCMKWWSFRCGYNARAQIILFSLQSPFPTNKLKWAHW